MRATDGFYGLFFAVLIAPLSVMGADRIQTYQVPKEPKTEVSAPVDKPLTWTVPANWQEQPASKMRIGQLAVLGPNGSKAELAITAFPGNLGSEMMNVNRWRRELGLDPVDESAVVSTAVLVGDDQGKLYEFSGPQEATTVAWVTKNGTSFFFKLRGDSAAVTPAKPAMIEFLKSVRFRQ